MYVHFKRLVDICVAATFLILFIIPSAIIALIIRLESKGPVIFKQQRAGKDKKPFTIYKFRTMSIHAPKYSATNDLTDADSYITPIGKVIRKLSIDELPQLLNVIKGDMSIVGPRPVILSEVELLAERDKYDANACQPGITGWAQANGRDELNIVEKARMDGEYKAKFGLLMDFYCLVKTADTMVFSKGYREGSRPTPDTSYTFSPITSDTSPNMTSSSYANTSTIQ